MNAAASVVALLILLFTSQFELSLSSDDVPLPPQPSLGHPANHNHANDSLYVFTDTYTRVVEGEMVILCAELSQPVNYQIELYAYTHIGYSTTSEEATEHMYTYEYLIFEANTRKQCTSFKTTDDTNAGKVDLQFYYVDWYNYDGLDDLYFYHESDLTQWSSKYSSARSVVAIEDDDVLTLTPNATSITVYEGDSSEICVTPNQLAGREVPSLFYVLFDDKGDYTADIDYDLQYNHSSDDSHHYGGIYSIAPSDNQTCFHFHTKDDDVFEGNEDFSIKLFSFTPTKYNGSDINNGTINFFDIFNHVNVIADCHDDLKNRKYESIRYSEHLYSDTVIPDSLSTIHVTIVDNDEAPCLPQKGTKPCLKTIINVACLRIQQEFENHKDDIPKPCQRNIDR